MKVSEVLKNKGAGVEVTVPDMSIGEVASLLMEKRIGSLVVCDESGQVTGIVTERDIVKGLSSYGQKVLKQRASDLMSKALVCTPEVDVGQVMRVMTNDRVRHLVVMAGDELRGIVSIGDVVQSRLDQCQLEVNVLRDYVRVGPSPRRRFA